MTDSKIQHTARIRCDLHGGCRAKALWPLPRCIFCLFCGERGRCLDSAWPFTAPHERIAAAAVTVTA